MQGGKSGMRKRGRWMLVAREGRGCEAGGGRSAEWGEEARLAEAGWQSEVRK